MKKTVFQLPPPPKGLSAASRKLWQEWTKTWPIRDVGLRILESALRDNDLVLQREATLKAEGLIVEDRWHQKKAHPCTGIMRDAKSSMLKHIKSLGVDLEPIGDPGRPAGS